jgi:hypothetical protein
MRENCAFKCLLNVMVLTRNCNNRGRQFQAAGSAYENARGPNVRSYCGSSYFGVPEECSLLAPGKSAVACISSLRQDGLCPTCS